MKKVVMYEHLIYLLIHLSTVRIKKNYLGKQLKKCENKRLHVKLLLFVKLKGYVDL